MQKYKVAIATSITVDAEDENDAIDMAVSIIDKELFIDKRKLLDVFGTNVEDD